MGRPSFFAFAFVAAGLGAVACSSDQNATSEAISSFCASYMSASTFSCCTAADRSQAAFLGRYRFTSAALCESTLSQQLSQSNGHQVFDAQAASSCLAYLNGRACGTQPTASVKAAEEQAGCGRVLAGTEDVGQACVTQEDCKPGLFCPSSKDTGSAFCSKPATENQDCYGQQAGSVTHPACAQGLLCIYQGTNPDGCPSPPCDQYACVPPFEQGDACAALECGQGLACTDGTCEQGGPNPAGGFCLVTEHCASGLYCDTDAKTCAPQKADGQPCSPAKNALFECKGICAGAGATGTCSSFCGQ